MQESLAVMTDVMSDASVAEAIQSLASTTAEHGSGLDTVWLLVAGFLVMFMQPGFAMVESGYIRSKNTVNVLMKNFVDFFVGSLFFWAIGFGLMFGEGNPFVGLSRFFMGNEEGKWVPGLAFLFFQTVFAGTAATIVSGAMAERMKFVSYLIMTTIMTAIIYPIIGHWTWGSLWGTGGFLGDWGFLDFAGSTVVHGVGGAVALAGAIVLGSRKGKYNRDGSSNIIAPHNIPLAALGTFILWFGWFGFNPGSQALAKTWADQSAISLITVNTNLAAAAGGLIALLLSWVIYKKADASMAMNGVLAGLVAITAPCYIVEPHGAIIIGGIAGIIVVISVNLLDKMKIDDPVGAISVHGVCGFWGTVSLGLFGTSNGLFYGFGAEQLMKQAAGSALSLGAAFVAMLIIFLIMKFTIGLRVPEHEEMKGLDVTEHGIDAYGDFQVFSNK